MCELLYDVCNSTVRRTSTETTYPLLYVRYGLMVAST
jgi:hypothetical protein